MSDQYIKSLEHLIELLEKKNTAIDNVTDFINRISHIDRPLFDTLNKIIEGKNNSYETKNLNIHNHNQEPFFKRSALIKKKQDSVKNKIIDISSNKWDWNIVTGRVTFSSNWCASLGYKVSEIKPHVETWKNMVHPDDISQTFAQLNPHLEGKTSVYIARNRLQMKSGKWRNNIDAGRIIERDEKNNPIRMEGVDISLE
jgi:hypothetical protein